jgi:uncharacterized protein (TIGR00730 family)
MDYVCVYCGSSAAAGDRYDRAVEAFAAACLDREIGLVYGGAATGTMGTLADTMLAGGGEVIGIIPESILDRETPHDSLTRLERTDTKERRKARMAELADGFVALPGGLGTQEELFTALGQAKHGQHDNPCGYLNVAGYYDDLVAFLDGAVTEGFVSPTQRDLVLVDSDPGDLLDRFTAYESPL